MSVTAQVLLKFTRTANALTNAELLALHVYYKNLEAALNPCPDEYNLMLSDIRRKVDRLNDVIASRKADNEWIRLTPARTGTHVSCSV